MAITLESKDDRIAVKFGDELFTQYIFKGYEKPILYPVMAPGNVAITMAIRTHPALRVTHRDKDKPATGRALNSQGTTGKAIWGEKSKWVLYQGPINKERFPKKTWKRGLKAGPKQSNFVLQESLSLRIPHPGQHVCGARFSGLPP